MCITELLHCLFCHCSHTELNRAAFKRCKDHFPHIWEENQVLHLCVFFFFIQSGTDNTARGGRSEQDEKRSNHHFLGISFVFVFL